MTLGYHIDREEGLITLRAQGEVTLRALTATGRSMLADADYDPEFPQLLDFRGMRVAPSPPAGPAGTDMPAATDLQRLQQFVSGSYRQQARAGVAVVIDEKLESQHCADIYLLTCAIEEAELFCDYQLALNWLMRQRFAVA
ncbi:MAG: hypothetical protein ACNA7W_04765 [Pseudomonadales bacterium]